ncbi:MAG TPA: hypothetical protein VHK91_17445 [Flavisolibacter sp.]|jgi:hypothetical protein|nr:hypothetical protein [Flavisolibacter sp.]
MRLLLKPACLILTAILIIALPSCKSSKTIAVEEGWELLAERKVNFVRDKDEIDVTSTSQFTGIQFQVQDRDVRISDLKIYFDNGDKLEPALDEVITAGQKSRYIEFSREGRIIDKMEFKYRTTGSVLKGRASVLVFGRRFGYRF